MGKPEHFSSETVRTNTYTDSQRNYGAFFVFFDIETFLQILT